MTNSSHKLLLRRLLGCAQRVASNGDASSKARLEGMLLAYELQRHSTPASRVRTFRAIMADLVRQCPAVSPFMALLEKRWPELCASVEVDHVELEKNQLVRASKQ